jgi:hypothetical protein
MMSLDDSLPEASDKPAAAHRHGSTKQRYRPEQALLINESEPQNIFAKKVVAF